MVNLVVGLQSRRKLGCRGIQVHVVTNRRAVDDVLLGLGIEELIEVVASRDSPVLGVASWPESRLMIEKLRVIDPGGELAGQFVAGHSVPGSVVNIPRLSENPWNRDDDDVRTSLIFGGYHELVLLIAAEIL